MSEHDSFEDRLRAIADQISQSVQRISEVDLDEVGERYGIDPERARAFAEAAGQWLSQGMSGGEPFFGRDRHDDPDNAINEQLDAQEAQSFGREQPIGHGPHPLDLPTGRQGLGLSALDSGRWTVSPGSNRLIGTGEGTPPPEASDLVSEL